MLLNTLSEVEVERDSWKQQSSMPTVSGLIIDAFGELRDQLDSVKENMESNCFICGIGKDYFDTVPHGFDTHVAKEHNLANYM
jgi:ryanodine receptor 2